MKPSIIGPDLLLAEEVLVAGDWLRTLLLVFKLRPKPQFGI